MTRARVMAAIRGEAVDRPPVALWRHFPETDGGADTLAASHLAFQARFRLDILKVTPASGYYGDDWGLQAAYSPNPEGVRTYTGLPVKAPSDWRTLAHLDPRKGVHGRELECLTRVRGGLPEDVPVLATVFSPLSIARTLAGEARLLSSIRSEPESLKAGLEIITEATARFAAECLAAGAHGIFFATQMARAGLLSREEYLEFGRPYDARVLAAAGRAEILFLHLHGEGVYFDLFRDYPVHIVNWHDRRTAPTLLEARAGSESRCLAGGIDESRFARRSPEEVAAEVRDAVAATGGLRHIVAPGWSSPSTAPPRTFLRRRRGRPRGVTPGPWTAGPGAGSSASKGTATSLSTEPSIEAATPLLARMRSAREGMERASRSTGGRVLPAAGEGRGRLAAAREEAGEARHSRSRSRAAALSAPTSGSGFPRASRPSGWSSPARS